MSKTLIWKRLLIWSVCLWGLIFALPNAFYPQVERYNDALAVQTETGALSSAEAADLTGWPTWLPSSLVNLGLDLRGGAHLLAEVQVEDVYAARMDALWPQIREALRDLRAEVGTIRRQDAATGELRIALSEPTGEQAALAAVRALASPVTSLTGAGQNDIEVRADGGVLIVTLSAAERAASDQRTMQHV